MRNLLGVAQQVGLWAAKGAASSAERLWAVLGRSQALSLHFSVPCPGQSATGYRAWSSGPQPLTDVPRCNPKFGGSWVSCFCIICSSRQGNPAPICPSGLPGQQALLGTFLHTASWQEQQGCDQLLVLAPLQLFIWERWSLQRGMVASSFSFQGCRRSLRTCLSAMICKVCTQPAEVTEAAKQLIIKHAFLMLLLEKRFCSKALRRIQCSFTSKEYPDTGGKYWPAFSMLISVLLSTFPDSFSEISEFFSPLKNSQGCCR